MTNPTDPTAPAITRCDRRSALGLGCARGHGHAGACWFTARPDEARAALLAIGIGAKEATR